MLARPISLKGLAAASVTALALLTLLATVAMIATARYGHNLVARLTDDLESVRSASSLQVNLLVHQRETALLRRMGGEDHARARSDAQRAVQAALATMRRFDHEAGESQVIGEVEEALGAYFQDSAEWLARPDPTGTAQADNVAATDRVLERLAHLVEVNYEAARRDGLKSDAWADRAVLASRATAGLLALTVLGVLWVTRRAVYRPLLGLAGVVAGYGRGRRSERARDGGVVELRDLAARFNDMADALEAQRRQQLGFVAAVAHDLRNPIAALKLAADSVARSPTLPGEAVLRRMLDVVGRQARSLDRMVEDLLDTAHIEVGELRLERRTHDLSELVRSSVALNGALSDRHTLELELPAEPVSLFCDAVRIEQVLNNLISNAIKYSPLGGAVKVGLRLQRERVELYVTDRGIGIPAAEQQRIFESFHRVRRARADIPGVGLGLSVVRRIVEAHGGTISVESAPGEGSTFRVQLPRAAAAAVSEAAQPPAPN